MDYKFEMQTLFSVKCFINCHGNKIRLLKLPLKKGKISFFLLLIVSLKFVVGLKFVCKLINGLIKFVNSRSFYK